MLSLGWVIFAVVLAAALTSWVTFTATRLDRLHARVDAAQAALDAQLVRRAAAVQRVAAVAAAELDPQLAAALAAGAAAALAAGPAEREPTENALGRVANQLADVSPDAAADVRGRPARGGRIGAAGHHRPAFLQRCGARHAGVTRPSDAAVAQTGRAS